MWQLYFTGGFLGFEMLLAVLSFTVILPRMQKMNEAKKKAAEEEKVRMEQNKTLIEKEKLERELTKQKLLHDAEFEMKSLQPKYCQYCGAKIPAGVLIALVAAQG